MTFVSCWTSPQSLHWPPCSWTSCYHKEGWSCSQSPSGLFTHRKTDPLPQIMQASQDRLPASHSSPSSQVCFQFSSVQSLSRVRLFATPWFTARQASLSITNSRNSLRLTSIKSVMPSSHLILCHPLLPPSVFRRIRVSSNESVLCISAWSAKW